VDERRATDRLVAEQVRYYEERAAEYDLLWRREGGCDLGPERNEAWFRETAVVEASVDALAERGSVLELACGTGLWTRRLSAAAPRRLLAVDTSPAMLSLNREHTADPRIEYALADVFAWDPPSGERFDLIFMGFFMSHVPPDRFAGFWERLAEWLAPGGRVFLCDDRDGPGRPYSGEAVPAAPAFAHRRRLADGREYTIVKRFWSPEDLTAELDALGWDADIRSSGREFLFGSVRPR